MKAIEFHCMALLNVLAKEFSLQMDQGRTGALPLGKGVQIPFWLQTAQEGERTSSFEVKLKQKTTNPSIFLSHPPEDAVQAFISAFVRFKGLISKVLVY